MGNLSVGSHPLCDLSNYVTIIYVGSRRVVVLVLWVQGSVGVQRGYNGVLIPSLEEYNEDEVSLGITLVK